MGVDRTYVAKALADVRAWVAFLRKLGPPGSDELTGNLERRLAVLHALQLSIQTLLDLGAHVLSCIKAPAYEDYSDIGRLLAEHGILPADLGSALQKMARFRNLLVHGYAAIDLSQVATILVKNLGDLEAIELAIVRFVDRLPDPPA